MSQPVKMPSSSESRDSSGSPICSSDIHSDGTVELSQRWSPGGAQGNHDQLFEDGEQYIFAIRLADDSWQFYAVYAHGDSETPIDFRTADGEPWDAWTWDEVEWFCEGRDLDLPYRA